MCLAEAANHSLASGHGLAGGVRERNIIDQGVAKPLQSGSHIGGVIFRTGELHALWQLVVGIVTDDQGHTVCNLGW